MSLTQGPASGLRFPGPGESITVILKLPGETCNINCHYCYERRKPYSEAVILRPETLARFLALCGTRPLRVVLHGGEPLLIGREHLALLLEELRRYPGPLRLAMQTNGILLNEVWLDHLDRLWPGLEIAISLDGDPAANAHRVDFAERATHAKVARALHLLGERRRSVGAIAVVTRRSLGRAREILDEFLLYPTVRVLKLSPCLDYNVRTKDYDTPNRRSLQLLNLDGRGMPGWATSPAEYASFITEAWEAWRETGAFRHFLLEPHLSIVRNLAGKGTRFTHFGDRKEPFILTLYPDGRVGSSDEFDMVDAHLGHVDELGSLDDVLQFATNPRLRARLEALMERCTGCAYNRTCGGGSLSDRLRLAGTPHDEEYCRSRMDMVDRIAREMVADSTGGERSAAGAGHS